MTIIAAFKRWWKSINKWFKNLFKTEQQKIVEYVNEAQSVFKEMFRGDNLSTVQGYVITNILKTDDRDSVIIVCKPPNTLDRGHVIYVKSVIDHGLKKSYGEDAMTLVTIIPFVGDPLAAINSKLDEVNQELQDAFSDDTTPAQSCL